MAIGEGKVRLTVTMPNDAAEVIRREAKMLNLTVSQYVYLTMMANSAIVDGRLGDLAAHQLEVTRAIKNGYEVSEFEKNVPKLV